MFRSLLLSLLIFLAACGNNGGSADPCDRFFEPYSALVHTNDPVHQKFSDGMVLYAEGHYRQAAELLAEYTAMRGYKKQAHLYLAMCLIATDRPFEAELQLDHLENSNISGFSDQTEWYTLICWVCSDQQDRALAEAERIAARPRHTYKKEAAQLAEALRKK